MPLRAKFCARLSQLLQPLHLALLAAALLSLSGQVAHAGGPKYIAGVSYFDPGTAGTPLTWGQGQINYYTDQGDLSPTLPGASADAFVADAFSQWIAIPTAAVSATRAGQLDENVSGDNVFVNPDGTLTMPSDILPTATSTPVGIVYDADGSVTSALLGRGAGDSSECFYNAAFGGIDNFTTDAHFLHALVIVNGNCVQISNQLPDVKYRLVRVLGRVLGLDWSQVNINVLTHNPPPTQDDYAGFPVMHAIDPPNCIPITLCYPSPDQPTMDDQAALSRLYPVTADNVSNFPGKKVFSDETVRIHGSVVFTDTGGLAGQGMQGVNVVARWIDPDSGLPSRSYAAASVSGFLFCGNAGNTVTGFDDGLERPFNRYGSNDIALEGFFDLAGLQIPNGGTSGRYQLTIEAVDPFWSMDVGPYGPLQVQSSGSTQPILVNVSRGGDFEQDILMQGSGTQSADPFPLTTYDTPAALPLGGDWRGSLGPYGDLDYFWFTGRSNRTMSVFVTALGGSGAASEDKARPVIGMWRLSEPEHSPAPANTPSAFKTSYFGMTMLNAELLQTTGFRIGISDIRGDGRPDYRYHARVLYGDDVSPARASVAGGTPLTITGLGFQANTRISVAKSPAPALSVTASQALISAPPLADGVQDITLVDPPTLASSILTGVVTYGAGPEDILRLLPGTTPSAPVGGQAPYPVRVQVFAPDGTTSVQGASVFFTASPAAGLSACSGSGSCTVLTDQSGLVSTFVTLLATGTTTVTAQLAPASYPSPKQVQSTLRGTSSSLDIALAPQQAWIAQGAAVNLTLTARVLSNGVPLNGKIVNFQVVNGSGTLNPPSVPTNSNGYASSTLELTSFARDVQVSACVGPLNSPCLAFYGTPVPASGMQLQPVAGSSQAVAAGQSFQPVTVRATDLSTPPHPVLGADMLFQYVVERAGENSRDESGGDTEIGRDPAPVILYSSQGVVVSDGDGLASFRPTAGGFDGALDILGTASGGTAKQPFKLKSLPPKE